jgi:hypothetical protein
MSETKSIIRVSTTEDWEHATEAIQNNELLGCVMESFTSDDIDLDANTEGPHLDPRILPKSALELAVIATNNSIARPFRVNAGQPMHTLPAFREASSLHHDGVRGFRIGSLVSSVTLQGQARAYLKRVPTFSRSKLKSVTDSYKNPKGEIEIKALESDFTSIDLGVGDVLAFSAAGNFFSRRYPVVHYFEAVENPRLSVSLGDFCFMGRPQNLRTRLGYYIDPHKSN